LGLQQELTGDLRLEISHTGSVGRKLASSDIINRWGALPTAGNPEGRYNPSQPDILFRSNQGTSNHVALQVSLQQRWSRDLQFLVAYTLSRTRDVQSDPVGRISAPAASANQDASSLGFYAPPQTFFARQGDPSSNYGYADFDQRHSFLIDVIAQSPFVYGLPRLMSGWQFAALAAVRAGFPFSVLSRERTYIEPGTGLLYENRANYWGAERSEAFLENPVQVPGGLLVLDDAKFDWPARDHLGNMPRNAFRGPGLWNMDFSMSRSFALPRLGEGASLQFRAEFFNVFNHTNLADPDNALESPTFGQAFYGRPDGSSVLPSLHPVEKPRRVQFALKVYF
jgi:hypothetical protein